MGISIHAGDIFLSNAEALVLPGNMQPDLGWGTHIAEHVNKICEQSVRDERQAFGSLALGEACLSTGAGTNFSKIIHAIVLNKYDMNPLFLLRIMQRVSDKHLTSAIQASRAIAEESGMQSVAISAMGAGIGGMNYRKCCRMTFELLWDSPLDWRFYAFKPRHQKIAETVYHALS